MQNELEGLYNMLVSQTDIMKKCGWISRKIRLNMSWCSSKNWQHGSIMNVSVINIWQLLKLRKN